MNLLEMYNKAIKIAQQKDVGRTVFYAPLVVGIKGMEM